MAAVPRRYRGSSRTLSPTVYFILLLCFGLLFTGCTSEPTHPDYTTFTAEELEEAERIKNDSSLAKSTGSSAGLSLIDSTSSIPTTQRNPEFESFREVKEPVFIVNNPTLNVRSEPNVRSQLLATLQRGDTVSVVEIVDAAWAKIQLKETEAYVALRFLSKVVSEAQLAEDKKQYEGLYFVDFDFLNVRKNTRH